MSSLIPGKPRTIIPLRPGYWYMSPAQIDGGATPAAITADRLYALPIELDTATSIAKIGTYVTTGSATNLRFGLYTDVGGTPGALLWDSGSISANLTNTECAGTVGVVYPAGVYWLAMVGDGTPTIEYVTNGESLNVFGMTAVNLATRVYYVYKAHAYAALPASFGAVTNSTSNSPGIRFQVTAYNARY